MGKTDRGEKGAGFDYWGKRPLSGNCGYGKKLVEPIPEFEED